MKLKYTRTLQHGKPFYTVTDETGATIGTITRMVSASVNGVATWKAVPADAHAAYGDFKKCKRHIENVVANRLQYC